MQRAIELAQTGMDYSNGGPFGAVVVKKGKIIGEGNNQVTSSNDPTAHAEVVAIRKACETLGTFQLEDCELYTTCEPCPMCLGAIYWARPARVFYACSREDAANAGFDDQFIYSELNLGLTERSIPLVQVMRKAAFAVFKKWASKTDKINY